MREKLIDLIRKADRDDYESLTQDEHHAYIADFLIANGVIIPVLCKECRAYNTKGCCEGFGWCQAYNQGRTDDDFCKDGERGKYEQ